MSWLRIRTTEPHQGNGTYVNLENGARLGVNEYTNRKGQPRHRVWLKVNQQPAETMGDDFLTREDALAALDGLMNESEFGFRQLEPPVSEADRAEAARLEAEKNAEKEEEVK